MKHPSLASNIDVCPTSNHFSLLSYLILIYTDTHICTCVDHFFFLYIQSPTCDGNEQVELKRNKKNREKKETEKKSWKRDCKKKFMMKKR